MRNGVVMSSGAVLGARHAQGEREEQQTGCQAHDTRAVGGLSGADPAAWANAKRMKSTSDVLSVRVGRSHRLLFRTSGDAKRLEVLELVARRDLEAALRRYR